MSNTVKDEMLANLSLRERDLRDQLKEIKLLRAALKGVGQDEDSNGNNTRTSSKSNGLTFKEMIFTVLSEKGRGAEATEILELIKSRFGKEIKRSSISPQLSRLKSDGIIMLDDKVWYLPEHRIVSDVMGSAPDAGESVSHNQMPRTAPAAKPLPGMSRSMPPELELSEHEERMRRRDRIARQLRGL